jgi:putative transposase
MSTVSRGVLSRPSSDKGAGLYTAFVRRTGPYVWRYLVGQFWLGKPEWIVVMQKGLGAAANDAAIPFVQRPPVRPELVDVTRLSGTRDDAIRAAYATDAFSMRRIAGSFGLRESTVSRIVNCTPSLRAP